MSTYSLRTNSALRARFDGKASFDRNYSRPPRTAVLLSMDQHSRLGEEGKGPRNYLARALSDHHSYDAIDHAVEIFPSDFVKRRAVTWDGMAAEVVQVTRNDKIEFRFRAPFHLLVVYEEGVRRDGATIVEGLPRSTLRDVKRKLTFVPAGHEYREWQEARTLSRVVYFYFDPDKMPVHPEASLADTPFAPRLFFEDNALWETALKLATLIGGGSDNRRYCEALGTVLAHELVRLSAGAPRVETPVRGGLAAWQQRTVTTYIEEHFAERISLATLAQLVRLSPYYFCRAFKQSFGMPPHRYHSSRRIEQAKSLLAKPASSVTDIGLTVGFSETSSFSAAFRKATGLTPTAYRRTATTGMPSSSC
jgi:AraC family transcriptional regulator